MTLSLEDKARHRPLAKTRTLLQDASPVDGDPGPTPPSPPDAPHLTSELQILLKNS